MVLLSVITVGSKSKKSTYGSEARVNHKLEDYMIKAVTDMYTIALDKNDPQKEAAFMMALARLV